MISILSAIFLDSEFHFSLMTNVIKIVNCRGNLQDAFFAVLQCHNISASVSILKTAFSYLDIQFPPPIFQISDSLSHVDLEFI